MDAATAGLLGASLVLLGNAVVTGINRYFDERKSRRNLMINTAWDYYVSVGEAAKNVPGGILMPFEVFLLYTPRVVELALRENLSKEEIVDEMRKIHQLERELIKLSNDAHPGRRPFTGV
jgi:hypothetical protein